MAWAALGHPIHDEFARSVLIGRPVHCQSVYRRDFGICSTGLLGCHVSGRTAHRSGGSRGPAHLSGVLAALAAAGRSRRRFKVMRKDNAIARSDPSGTTQQSSPAEPAESALERYLAVIADADESEAPAQHSARVGPKVVSEVMTSGVVAAHEHAAFKVIVASLVGHRVSAAAVLDDDRKVIGVVSESDLLARVVAESDHTPAIGHLRHGRRERLEKIHGETASRLMTK